ncbi:MULTISPECIES: TonB-dependent receptor [unclassified Sphingomonas]|uniref:TonB-dependent receptor n=1 Tax=unclassified Sphingomonas TaxID=196159 RepID=UPI0003126FC6|nr:MULTISPECIES: TonB-dependent receptor [unclassified Sphingomonas]KTF70207.1 TonB-dependent receptor [Sphingomonas sp. WG]
MSRRVRASLAGLPFLALAPTLPQPAHAQAQPEEDAPSDIVVTAARTVLPPNALPLTIDVIDKTALDQQIAISGSVTDAVSNLTPSFSPTRQKLSGAGETLRGRSPLYAINGIPQSTPLRDGSRDGFTIDGFFVDRVELIYGSNALQGIGGTGGIVNQVTLGAPKKEGLGGRALLQGSADSDFRGDGLGGKAAGLLEYKAGAFDVAAGAAFEKRGVYYDGDGRRVGLNLTQGETQDSNTLSLFARIGYQASATGRFDLIASRFKMQSDGDYVAVAGNRRTGLPTSATRGTPPGTAAASRTESVALSYTDTGLWGGNLVSQIFWNRTHDTFGAEVTPIATFQDAAIAPIGTLVDQSENRSRKIGGKISYERAIPGFEALTTTLGFDVLTDRTEQRLILTNRTWVPPTDFRSLAPFAQANLALFEKRVRLAGGVRYENVRIRIDDYRTLASTTTPAGGVTVKGGSPTFESVLFNGGLVVEPVPGIRGYLSYAEGYTVPDIGRITRAVNRPGVSIDTFLDIAPVISNNREVGVEVKRGPLDGSVAYFWSSSDKGQLLIANPGGIFDVQRLRVEIQGLEANLGVRLPIPGTRVSIGYAHLVGKYDSDAVPDGKVDTDLDGTNISPDRLNLAADYVRGPFSARVQGRFFLARGFYGKVRDPRNDFGGYTLVDATMRYQTRFGGLTLSASNLLDKQYIDYNSDTRLPADNLSFFAGRGRSFTLGWDYRF